MVFTPQIHARVATVTMLCLPFLLLIQYCSPDSVIYTTLLSNHIQRPSDLSPEARMQLLHNHTLHPPDPHAQPPLVLHFSPHVLSTHSFAVLFALLIEFYAFLSLAWAKNADTYCTLDFDAAMLATDMMAMLTDNVFWLAFALFHAYAFLLLITIATMESVFLFVGGTLFLSWALCSRMLAHYPPALVFTAMLLMILHAQVFFALIDRNPDLWTSYFLILFLDTALIAAHMIDNMLSATTAMNCRISYLFGASVWVVMSAALLVPAA